MKYVAVGAAPRAWRRASPSGRAAGPELHVEPAERRALLTALAATTEPPVLGCASAGIGKTTTLVQWTAKEMTIGPGGAYAGGR